MSRPTVPKDNKTGKAIGESGITVGVGVDTGQMNRAEIEDTFKGYIPDQQVARLAGTAGLKEEAAIAREKDLQDIQIPYQTAKRVFEDKTLPGKSTETARTFPGMERLHEDAQGALVSLIMNRGSSMRGESRKEMRDVRDAISVGEYKKIPDIIRSMADRHRANGLKNRRRGEANLFEGGLNQHEKK